MDTFSPSKRSWVMGRIKSGDTSPEIRVRSFFHRLGLRFRIHRKDLPGKPDLVFPSRRLAIFVHGCFWHQCPYCSSGRLPKSNLTYWERKLRMNKERDEKTRTNLKILGWSVVVIWECQIDDKYLLSIAEGIKRNRSDESTRSSVPSEI